ncbi:MAG: hypothetical protein AB1646_24055 [Thermodesulfobacteriota bacterium]
MAKELNKYQPDRKDLRINTDWGVVIHLRGGCLARTMGAAHFLV